MSSVEDRLTRLIASIDGVLDGALIRPVTRRIFIHSLVPKLVGRPQGHRQSEAHQ